MLIRPARETDFARIAEMGEAFWNLTPYASAIPYSRDAVIHYSGMMFERGVLYVVEVDGEVVGSAGALFMPALGNLDYLVGAELFWWIEPAHRNGGTGQALLNALEDGARTAGATLFSMMAFETLDPDRVGAIYERHGYVRSERTYSKGLRDGSSNSGSSGRSGRGLCRESAGVSS